MKKRGILISVIIIAVVGGILFGGLRYFEKQTEEELKNEKQIIAEKVSETEEELPEIDSSEIVSSEIASSETEAEPQEIASSEDTASLVFAGDVYLSGYVTSGYDRAGITGVVDETLLAEMKNADILMINEEFPFGTKGTPAEDKQFTFRVNPSYISVFEDMGVDIVSLANNHVLDYGQEVLQETFQLLKEKEIRYAGAGETFEEASALRTIEVGEKKYGFLSASRVIPVASWNIENSQPGVFTTYDETALVMAIEKAQTVCDFLTVYVHWGIERNTMPEEYQKQLAHAYINAGADLVIGAHPHVLQGIESYKGKLIFYSLGNFIFNQSIEKTMLVKVEQQDDEWKYSILPVYATGAKTSVYTDTEEFYSYIESLSEGISIEDGNIYISEIE